MPKKIISSILAKIKNRLKRPPKVKPRPRQRMGDVIGHRGIAAGSLEPGKQDFSAENVAKWQTLSGEKVAGFIYDGEILFVHSSNVAALQYHKDESKLMVEFLDGSAYLYWPISESKAIQFVKEMSKGSAVWNHLRVRGHQGKAKKGSYPHKVNYIQIK